VPIRRDEGRLRRTGNSQLVASRLRFYPVTIEVRAYRPPSCMKCPFCGHENDKVVDSRESKEGESIRRRRECLKCEKRFTTYERIDEIPYMVVKKDGRREKFERQKVLNGLLRACEKRPVSMTKLEQIVNDAEGFVIDSAERERTTSQLGELIMNRLRRLDKVAYVRFASVYLDFKDVGEFMTELKELLDTKEAPTAKAKSGD
jgi:transcriptional repressor NrdR